MASSRSWYSRNRLAASGVAPKSSNGWNASKVCIAPVKLIVRGATPCRAAAWAITVRIRLWARMCAHTSLRTSSGVLHLSSRICIADFRDRRSSSLCHRAVQRCQVLFGRLLRVEQRRHYHDLSGPEPRLPDPDPRLPNCDEIGQRVLGFPVQRPDRRRLGPADEVVVRTQPLPAAEIHAAV